MVACATCAVDWMYTDLNGREGASTKLPLAGAPRPVVPGRSRKSANTSKSLKKVDNAQWMSTGCRLGPYQVSLLAIVRVCALLTDWMSTILDMVPIIQQNFGPVVRGTSGNMCSGCSPEKTSPQGSLTSRADCGGQDSKSVGAKGCNNELFVGIPPSPRAPAGRVVPEVGNHYCRAGARARAV